MSVFINTRNVPSSLRETERILFDWQLFINISATLAPPNIILLNAYDATGLADELHPPPSIVHNIASWSAFSAGSYYTTWTTTDLMAMPNHDVILTLKLYYIDASGGEVILDVIQRPITYGGAAPAPPHGKLSTPTLTVQADGRLSVKVTGSNDGGTTGMFYLSIHDGTSTTPLNDLTYSIANGRSVSFTSANLNYPTSGYFTIKMKNNTTGVIDSTKTVTPATTGSIYCETDPPDALITLDLSPTLHFTPYTLTGISPGTHMIKLTQTGYLDYNTTVDVTAGGTATVAISMVPAGVTTGGLNITSTPSGAQVIFDEAVLPPYFTPVTLTNLSIGSHSLILIKSGYLPYEATVNVTAGVTTPIPITLTAIPIPPAGTGNISIVSNPIGANIKLDAAVMTDTTPAVLTGVSVGFHTITLSKTGYYDYATGVTVTSGATVPVAATLTERPGGAGAGPSWVWLLIPIAAIGSYYLIKTLGKK